MGVTVGGHISFTIGWLLGLSAGLNVWRAPISVPHASSLADITTLCFFAYRYHYFALLPWLVSLRYASSLVSLNIFSFRLCLTAKSIKYLDVSMQRRYRSELPTFGAARL